MHMHACQRARVKNTNIYVFLSLILCYVYSSSTHLHIHACMRTLTHVHICAYSMEFCVNRCLCVCHTFLCVCIRLPLVFSLDSCYRLYACYAFFCLFLCYPSPFIDARIHTHTSVCMYVRAICVCTVGIVWVTDIIHTHTRIHVCMRTWYVCVCLVRCCLWGSIHFH